MSNADYIRESAKKYKWYKYYSTLRPVSMGTQPKNGFMDFINYDERTEINGKMVWAELYYNRELTEKEMKDYDLVKQKGWLVDMTEIRIDNTGNGTWYLYNGSEGWKDYVGCEDFDEQVVLTGNRDFRCYTEASWYQKAKDVLTDIDYYDEYPDDLNDEIKAKLKELYDECRCTEDILIDVIRLLNPNDTFKSGTIRGYCQGDWQEYIVKENVDVEKLENFYF